MAKGGKRRGAGRKHGSLGQATKNKQLVEEEYRAFMLEAKQALWQAQRERACGVYVLLIPTDAGYLRVTDPDEIARITAQPATRGHEHFLIEAQAPDARLAKEINDRTMGVPTQHHEVGTSDGEALAIRIVHRELKE